MATTALDIINEFKGKKSAQEIAEILLKEGIDVNERFCGDSILLIESVDVQEMQILLAAGADVNIKDEDCNTALMKSAARSDTASVQLLIDGGADINAQDNDGETALMKASTEEIISCLVKAGADVEIKNLYGNSALLLCIDYPNALALIYSGADVLVRNDSNATILTNELSCRDNEYHALCSKYIAAGGDVNAKRDDGWTALMSSTLLEGSKSTQLLIENGADIHAKTEDGYTALDYARGVYGLTGNDTVAEYLIEQTDKIYWKTNGHSIGTNPVLFAASEISF